MIPTHLGSYPVERELGRGGMGVVYLARDPRLDRAVAIKVVPTALALNPDNGVQRSQGEDDRTSFAVVLNWLDRNRSQLPTK